MNRDLIAFVQRRAESTCEYCRLPQKYDPLTFEVDHVTAIIHGGTDAAGNLALSCFPCNRHKGPNLTGIDPITRKTVKLFHPRRHSWSRHFAWDGPLLVGRTAIGRTTIRVLQINEYLRVCQRRELIAERVFPQ